MKKKFDEDKMMPVAQFATIQEAQLCSNLLVEHGIESMLWEKVSPIGVWAIDRSVDVIEVQVRNRHLDESIRILDENMPVASNQKTLNESASDNAELDSERLSTREEKRISSRSKKVNRNEADELVIRILKNVVFSYILPPLFFYAVYLLFSLPSAKGRLSGQSKFFLMMSFLLMLPISLLIIFFFMPFFR